MNWPIINHEFKKYKNEGDWERAADMRLLPVLTLRIIKRKVYGLILKYRTTHHLNEFINCPRRISKDHLKNIDYKYQRTENIHTVTHY